MPHKADAKPRPSERDYSHRSLLDKLGVKPGQRICVLGVDDAAFGKLPKDCDLIFLGADNLKTLARIESLEDSIQRNGAIWVVYPKGQQHIREADVMAAGKSAGLTDNKICKFSETHTALRFVIPFTRR